MGWQNDEVVGGWQSDPVAASPAPVEHGLAARIAMGAYKGARKPLDNAALALEHGVNAITGLGFHSAEDANARTAATFNRFGRTSPAGEFAGNIAGTAAITSKLPGGAFAQGAYAGALNTDKSSPLGITVDALTGGVGGKIAEKVVGAASGLLSPYINAGIRRLHAQGVPMSIGTILQGHAAKAEDRLMSQPFVGDRIADARNASVDALNRVAVNRTVAPLGRVTPGAGTVPDTIATGHDMVKAAGDALSTGYQRVTARMRPVQLDPTLNTRLSAIKAGAGLPKAQEQLFDQIAGDDILAHFSGGPVNGKALKRIDEKLKTLAVGYLKNDDPHTRLLGQTVADARQQLMAMVRRQNPHLAAPLRALDEGWANLVRVETAAAKSVDDGIFNPSELRTAVRQTDQSVRKRAVGRGEALMQDLASDASLLPSRVPSSGTADRLAQASLPKSAIGYILSKAYAPGAQKAAQSVLLAPRPPAAKAISNALKKLPAGATGSLLLKAILSSGQ